MQPSLEYLGLAAGLVGTGYGVWTAHRKSRPTPHELDRAAAANKAQVASESLARFLRDVARGCRWGGQTLEDRWAPLATIEPTFNSAWDEVKTIIRDDPADRALTALSTKKGMLLYHQRSLRTYQEKHDGKTDNLLYKAAYGDDVIDEIDALQGTIDDILRPIARHEKPKRTPRFTEDDVMGAVGMVALVAFILLKELG